MKIHVLLVDDEKEFADTLSERLNLRQFVATPVYSGESALEYVETGRVDVVILDVLMPGLSGIDTLRRIKESAPLVQVIMLTGHATVENAILGMKLGAFDFLMKPAETDDLSNKIKDAYTIKHDHEERIRKAEVEAIINRRGW